MSGTLTLSLAVGICDSARINASLHTANSRCPLPLPGATSRATLLTFVRALTAVTQFYAFLESRRQRSVSAPRPVREPEVISPRVRGPSFGLRITLPKDITPSPQVRHAHVRACV